MNDHPMNLKQSAIACHEYFISLKQAGFTRMEALYLVACAMSDGPRPPKDEGGHS
ncbi:hypothetical protein AB0I72_19290 [Nocardiopsis sp. NPDC049922]|uniref:hypothetical protein n=1 Tax=Nocardiopsis sp. NPDC049922 TaxID=3155157 RepID=UPI0033ED0B7B